MKKQNPRYIVHDELGPVRTFFTKLEATRWIKARPECRVETLPKPHEPSIFETTEEAVF